MHHGKSCAAPFYIIEIVFFGSSGLPKFGSYRSICCLNIQGEINKQNCMYIK